MKNKVCFICVGQCGGNIGMSLQKFGYDVLFMNTAQIDLDRIPIGSKVFKVPGADGCNQDPVKGQELFARFYDEVMSRIKEFTRKYKIVYFVSSASGGSGGGMVPLMLESFVQDLKIEADNQWDLYEKGKLADAPENRKAGVITVLPAVNESVVFNANAYNFLKQIGELLDTERSSENLASYFLIDNENCNDILELNKKFVRMFDEFMKIPDKHHSDKGNVDKADLEKAIMSAGVTVLCEIGGRLSGEAMINGLKSSMIFAPIGEEGCNFVVSSTTKEFRMSEIEQEIGVPMAHYKTFNNYVNLIGVGGLGFPSERIKLMVESSTKRAKVREPVSKIFNEEVEVMHTVTTEPIIQRVSVQEKLNMLKRRRR